MSVFYMTIGLPGAGKTTWAKEQGIDWHSSDAIREEFNTEDNSEVFAEMRRRALESLGNGKDCIYDATNMSKKDRSEILKIVRKSHAKRVAVLFLVPVDECKSRNSRRDKPVPDYVFDKMLRAFDIPMPCAEFEEIRIIANGEASESETRMLSKEYRDGFDQHNSYHTLTIGEHMDKSEEVFEALFRGKYPAYVKEAVKHHDMGKPFTFSVDDNGTGHFYGHEHVGAYWYLVTNYKDEDAFWEKTFKTGILINWHMRPLVWDSSSKTKMRDLYYIDRYDPDMYGQLHAMSKADRKAH